MGKDQGVMGIVDLAKAVAPQGAKHVVERGLRRYGTLTAGQRPLPDYLIIGTKRGGTTSLWKNLRRHPQVMSMFPEAENLKSPHFFDINWARGEEWYRSYFPTEAGRNRRVAATGGEVVVGDVSPYYLFHPLAAERAALVVPEAKIVVILRHPVDRAWSHYHERRKQGTEPLPFPEAVSVEDERLAAEAARIQTDPSYYSTTHDFCSYLARGRYLEQMKPWLARFPASSVLILRSESFFERPAESLREVAGFLGIDANFELRGPAVHMNRLLTPKMSPDMREELNAYFKPHVAALESALGRDFGWDLDSPTQPVP